MKKKADNNSRLADAMYSMVGKMPHLEMQGNREIHIEGTSGVLEYDSSIIRINTGAMVVSIKGRRLNLKCLTPSAVVVNGFIKSVEFVT